jgi:hypothetical protein
VCRYAPVYYTGKQAALFGVQFGIQHFNKPVSHTNFGHVYFAGLRPPHYGYVYLQSRHNNIGPVVA